MKKGDRIYLTCEGRTVRAEVALASANGKSLVFVFSAMVDGHVGTMPVLRDDDGTYRVLLTGTEITIEPVKEQLCPKCGVGIDAHTGVSHEDATPSPGDISMCLYCQAVLIFDADLIQREITEDELLALPADVRGLLLRASEALKNAPQELKDAARAEEVDHATDAAAESR